MEQPITLYIPEYYDQVIADTHSLKLLKTKQLLKEDNNKAQWIASIEKLEDYQCSIKEIPEEYLSRATNCFKRDREENWELRTRINECKVYTFNWDDKDCHFRIYWIVISEKYVLELTGIFRPQHSGFYKQHFMVYSLDTTINTDFDFSKETNPENVFELIKVQTDVSELKGRIEEEKEEKEKALFLKENLKVSKPDFYIILEAELKEKNEAVIASFMCRDWNMYYDLYNPENFSDPDSTIEWEDNTDHFEYYEKPFTNNSKTTVTSYEEGFDMSLLKHLVENKEVAEQNLLSFFENYTFGNGGAYAEGIHYKYAKIEIERLHNTSYTNQEFLKRNLCLREIETLKSSGELRLHFACSWDTEHGINIVLDKQYMCKAAH